MEILVEIRQVNVAKGRVAAKDRMGAAYYIPLVGSEVIPQEGEVWIIEKGQGSDWLLKRKVIMGEVEPRVYSLNPGDRLLEAQSDIHIEGQRVLFNSRPVNVDNMLPGQALIWDGTEVGGQYPLRVSDGTATYAANIIEFSGATISSQEETVSVIVPTTPIGSMMMWPTSSAPGGWLLCQGQAISRTAYAELFAVLGTTFGVGDGSSTFNLPDTRGRFILGTAASGTGSTLGGTGGALDHVHDMSSHTHSMQSHTHTVSSHAHSLNSHTHDLNSHTHSLNSHAHSIGSHSHAFSATSGTSSAWNGIADPGSGAYDYPPKNHMHSISGTTDPWNGGSTGTASGDTGAASGSTGASSGDTGSASPATGAPSASNTGTPSVGNTAAGNPAFMALNFIIRAKVEV